VISFLFARKNPPTVSPTDNFGRVAKVLIRHPAQTIFITGTDDSYRGAIVSSDILQFAQNKELADAIIAIDVSRNNLPVLLPEMKLPDALKIFASRKNEDSLALVEDEKSKKLLGVVNRSDLYLALGEIMRREKVR
jgi:CIC family chloride channel protein